jgi:murein DD-endopeptidase MepM/ murein hydrolase activator NlpD
VASGFDTGKAYSGIIELYLLTTDKDTAVGAVKIFLDDKDITNKAQFTGGLTKGYLVIDTRDLQSGPRVLTVIARDRSMSKNVSETRFVINVDNIQPKIDITNQQRLYYGKTAVILFLGNKQGLDIEGSFQKKMVKCYPAAGKYYKLVLGAELSDPPGNVYPLRLSIKDKAGNISQQQMNIKVRPSSYPVVSFYLRPKKKMLLSPDIVKADWERMAEVLVGKSDDKLWAGRFAMPTRGAISMVFGTLEYINGSLSGRHRGLDIANVKGTPIKASNHGVVVLAEYLPAHGNAVVIDHGRGIFSYYAHLSSIKADVGQKVYKGQLIGLMGSTGIATASHLHFGVSVHDTRVDPLQWVNTTVIN